MEAPTVMFYISSINSTPAFSSNEREDIWMIDDEVMTYIFTIDLAVIVLVISLFGVVANTINMIVFLRIGFQETINISLFALAISDMCSLLPLVWVAICYNPFFMYSDLPVDTIELQHYPGGWTHLIFGRITAFITVFITLERCLCIAFPLKIKQILTRPRVIIIIVCIWVVVIATLTPNFFYSSIGWKWDPFRNRTILGLVIDEDLDKIENISHYFQTIYPVSTFSFVVICTIIFAWKLNQRGKWLTSASSSQDKSQASANRDQKVIKLVVAVAVIFIVCYIPSVILFVSMPFLAELNLNRDYENLFLLIVAMIWTTEAVNSTVNIIVYYKMMTKYRQTFLALFRRSNGKEQNILMT